MLNPNPTPNPTPNPNASPNPNPNPNPNNNVNFNPKCNPGLSLVDRDSRNQPHKMCRNQPEHELGMIATGRNQPKKSSGWLGMIAIIPSFGAVARDHPDQVSG